MNLSISFGYLDRLEGAGKDIKRAARHTEWAHEQREIVNVRDGVPPEPALRISQIVSGGNLYCHAELAESFRQRPLRCNHLGGSFHLAAVHSHVGLLPSQ